MGYDLRIFSILSKEIRWFPYFFLTGFFLVNTEDFLEKLYFWIIWRKPYELYSKAMVPLTDRNHQKPPRRTSLKLQVYALNICKLRPFKNGKKSLVSLCHNENSQGATLQAASTFLSFFFKPIGSLSGIYFSLHFTYKKSTKCIRTKKNIYIYKHNYTHGSCMVKNS